MDIRKAIAVSRNTPVQKIDVVEVEPTQTDDSEEAYQQLVAMAEALRAGASYLSVSQAFARVAADQEGSELLARAHKRPNAGNAGAYPFPR